jgi:cyclic pyranopterin phosphate synthase
MISRFFSKHFYSTFTHLDSVSGKVKMVDVSNKVESLRTSSAGCSVLLGEALFNLISGKGSTPLLHKGDLYSVVRLSGILGAKKTSDLILLCHPLSLTNIEIELELNKSKHSIDITSKCSCKGPTGVEMEALTAVSIAALNVYDMCKAVSKEIIISDIRLLHKTGGKSGNYFYK